MGIMTRVLIAGFFLLVLFSLPVSGEKFFVKEHESVIVNGVNITFVGIEGEIDEAINVLVGSTYGIVEKKVNTTYTVNGVNLTLLGLSKNPPIAILDIYVPFSCGDKSCSSDKGESTDVCCNDCGCPLTSQACLSNICQQNVTLAGATYECYTDSDCGKLEQACLQASCDITIIPHQCITQQVVACVAGDQCCPDACTLENDKDCANVDKCHTSIDCNDGNPCTDDQCGGTPKRCSNSDKGGCVSQGICVAEGDVVDIHYCSASGKLVFLKEEEISCEMDYECATGACRGGVCRQSFFAAFLPYTILLSVLVLLSVVSYYLYLAMQRKQ